MLTKVLLLLLLTNLAGCMTAKTLETAEANGKIIRYEPRYFVALEKPANPNLADLCMMVQPEHPAEEREPSAFLVSIDFSRRTHTVKLTRDLLQTEAECLSPSSKTMRKLSVASPHHAGNLVHRGMAGRGIYATQPILVAHQEDDYAAPIQHLTVYRNDRGTITDSTELMIDTTELQQTVSRLKQVAAYAVVPFAALADVVTSPLQAIGALIVMDSLPKRY